MDFFVIMKTLQKTTLVLVLALFAVRAPGQTELTNPPGRVYRDHVEPHWFADEDGVTNQFWYRVNLPDNGREFIVVNAATGKREPAFDQKAGGSGFESNSGKNRGRGTFAG